MNREQMYRLKQPVPLPRIKSLPDLNTVEKYDETIDQKIRPLSTYNFSDIDDDIVDVGTLLIKHNNFKCNKKTSDASTYKKPVYENINELQQIVLEEKIKKPYEDLESHYNTLQKNKKSIIMSSLPDLVTHDYYNIPNKHETRTQEIDNKLSINEDLFIVQKSQLTTNTFVSPIENKIELLSVKNSLLSLPNNSQIFVDEEYDSEDSEYLDKKYLNYYGKLSKTLIIDSDNKDDEENIIFDLHFPSISQKNEDEINFIHPPKHANIKIKIKNVTENNSHHNYDDEDLTLSENTFSTLVNQNLISDFDKIIPYVESELQRKTSVNNSQIKNNNIQIPKTTSNNDEIREELFSNEKIENKYDTVIYATAEIHNNQGIKLEENDNTEIKEAILLRNRTNKFIIPLNENKYENTFSTYDILPTAINKVSLDTKEEEKEEENNDGYLIPNNIRISNVSKIEDDDIPPPLPVRGYLIPKSHFLKPVIEDSGIKLKTNEQHFKEDQMKMKKSKLYDIYSSENRLPLIKRLIFCGINEEDLLERFHINPMTRKPKFASNIDTSLHQSGTLCKIYENIEENEIHLTLQNGVLKYKTNQQELEISMKSIMHITAKKISRTSRWSKVFEITYWHEESDDTRVLELATRDNEERDTWMMRILQAITSAFPLSIMNHYTRAGWLCMKDEEDETWTPCWMLINDDSMFHCVEADNLIEHNLLSIRSIVSQRMNGELENIGITIDFGDKIIHLQGNTENDTKEWENYLLIASKLHIKMSEFNTDTLYEEIDENGEFIIRPPPVPFRPHASRKIHEEDENLGDLVYDEADNSTDSEDNNYQTLKNTLLLKQIENTAGNNMYISVHVGTYPSPIVMQIAIGPDTTAGEIQNRFGNMQNLKLQEYILNGSLKRPLQSKEKIFDTLLRWSEWDDIDRNANALVFVSNQTYYKAKALMKPNMTMSGVIRYADPSNKYTKPYWLEYSKCKLRLYKQEISSEKLTEWNIHELLWYFGHETKRNINSQGTITCIEKYNKPKRSKQRPYFGYTIESCDEDYSLWCAAFMVGNVTRVINNNDKDIRTRNYVTAIQ